MQLIKKYISILLCTTLISLLVLGCSDAFNIVTGSKSKKIVSSSNMIEKLAVYAALGNYTVTEEELQNDVLTALASSKKTPGDARSVSDIAGDYKLTGVTSEVYTIPEAQKNTRSAIESYNDINIYAYQFENAETEEKSYVLSCDDRRIGEIIAIADGEFNPDDDAPFIDIVKTGLEGYINKTIDTWNNLTDEDVRSVRSGAHDYIVDRNWYEVEKAFCKSDLDAFHRHILVTQWGQSSPANDFVKICEKKECFAGCGAVALAQICVDRRYPEYCSADVLSELKKNNCVPSDWDGKYNYYSMKYVDHYEYTPKMAELWPEGKMNVASLLYDIGKGIKMSYGVNGTTASGSLIEDVYDWLEQNDFYCSPILDYDYSAIETSINNGHPVYISGKRKERGPDGPIYYGHAWVIDDCGEYSCVINRIKTGEPFTITDNFVHCNWGWDGKSNGFYLSDLFNVSYGALFKIEDRYEQQSDGSWRQYPDQYKDGEKYDDRSHPYTYSYNLKIISDIY